LASGNTGALSDRYTFYGSNADIQTSNDTELVMSGAAGTGKSLACLTKLHRIASHHKWARILIVRKTRVSLTDSGLVTFERYVLGEQHPLVTNGASRAVRHSYVYPNGSEIVIGGMDNPTRVMSTEWDMIYVQEAIELEQVDIESLNTRLRNGRVPFQQLLADTNPGAPMHWLKQRCEGESPRMRMVYCQHEDNPMLFDHDTQTWTERGLKYLQTLDNLTGVMKDRLRYGRWVQAEGVVFDNFDPRFNVTTDAEYNPDWRVIWGCDDGYVRGQGIGSVSYHPRVVLFLNITPQGGVNVFDEYVATEELSEVTIEGALGKPYKKPDIAYVDSSAQEFKNRMHLRNVTATGGTHPVNEGIKNLRRLVCDGQGVRMLKVHPRCTHLIREMASYRYDDKSKQVNAGEPKPLKLDDHSIDALRYATFWMRFNK
jgi:PBSX family phage terminase large subunit